MCDFVHCNYQFDAVFICVFSSGNFGGQLQLIYSSAIQSVRMHDKSFMWSSLTFLFHDLIFSLYIYNRLSLFSDSFCLKCLCTDGSFFIGSAALTDFNTLQHFKEK